MDEVDFQATTTAVLKGFNHGFIDMVVKLLQHRNTAMVTPDGKQMGTYANVPAGYGLLVMVDDSDDKEPFTITTEFLVPSNELAASFMVMWRRWCDRRGRKSSNALLWLMNKVAIDMKEHIAQGNQQSNNNLAIGLMGAVLDNYPEIVASMQWSVDSGFVPCLVIAQENDKAKCGVCYGGRYMTAEMEPQLYGT